MFCTHCGAEQRDGDRFCGQCGASTIGAPGSGAASAPRNYRLSRLMAQKKIAGVCAGFARYLNIDVTLVRVLWIVVTITTGVGLIAYIVGWIVMPKEEELQPAVST